MRSTPSCPSRGPTRTRQRGRNFSSNSIPMRMDTFHWQRLPINRSISFVFTSSFIKLLFSFCNYVTYFTHHTMLSWLWKWSTFFLIKSYFERKVSTYKSYLVWMVTILLSTTRICHNLDSSGKTIIFGTLLVTFKMFSYPTYLFWVALDHFENVLEPSVSWAKTKAKPTNLVKDVQVCYRLWPSIRFVLN